MREALTDTFRQALAEAQISARKLNQDFVGTEHLMLGLLKTEGEAHRALRTAHAEPSELASELADTLPAGDEPPVVTGDLPLSPKSQRIINAAIVKAQSLRDSKVSTRFLLLALLDEPQSPIRKTLEASGVDVDALQPQLAQKPEKTEA